VLELDEELLLEGPVEGGNQLELLQVGLDVLVRVQWELVRVRVDRGDRRVAEDRRGLQAVQVGASILKGFGQVGEVFINLKLSITEPILIRLKLLWQLIELPHDRLINISLLELSLPSSPLPDLNGPCYLRILPYFSQRSLYHGLLDHLASEVEVVATGLWGEVTDHVLVDARDINHREVWQLALYGFFQVGSQLHFQGLPASHKGEGTCQVLNDQVGGIQDFMVVGVKSEVFKD